MLLARPSPLLSCYNFGGKRCLWLSRASMGVCWGNGALVDGSGRVGTNMYGIYSGYCDSLANAALDRDTPSVFQGTNFPSRRSFHTTHAYLRGACRCIDHAHPIPALRPRCPVSLGFPARPFPSISGPVICAGSRSRRAHCKKVRSQRSRPLAWPAMPTKNTKHFFLCPLPRIDRRHKLCPAGIWNESRRIVQLSGRNIENQQSRTPPANAP